MKNLLLIPIFILIGCSFLNAQPYPFRVIAYYMGPPENVGKIQPEKLTDIIFSFCHLEGNQLRVDNSRDSSTIRNLVALKKKNASLKVILSLGGWGGCATCSEVFSTLDGRTEFASSVVELLRLYNADGIDLDWEYPAIAGYPEHAFKPEDRKNFTSLVATLRKAFGKRYELSFAAGGFTQFLEESIEWKEVMEHVDHVNLMSYDLINGYSTVTGHHTALYSTPQQKESTDNAVTWLLGIGVPASKIVIGSAFYGRMWEDVSSEKNGLYQSGKFKAGIDFNKFSESLSLAQGYVYYWDDVAKAPYLYNATEKHFVTHDDTRSITLKSQYVVAKKLKGIMFWELNGDVPTDGLLDAIIAVKKAK
jgi:chitinase